VRQIIDTALAKIDSYPTKALLMFRLSLKIYLVQLRSKLEGRILRIGELDFELSVN